MNQQYFGVEKGRLLFRELGSEKSNLSSTVPTILAHEYEREPPYQLRCGRDVQFDAYPLRSLAHQR